MGPLPSGVVARVQLSPDRVLLGGIRSEAVRYRPLTREIRSVGEPEVAPGIRFVEAPGHTPGHRAFHLSSGSDQLMISNDTAYVPALVVANPGWRGAYDQDGATAETSRRALLDRVIADKIQICGYHFPFPGAGTIAKDGTGYALTVMKS